MLDKNFFILTNESITLSKSQISKIRNKIINKYKNLELYKLINIIQYHFPNLYQVINDINYNITIKNKDTKREQRLIFFGNKDKFPLISYKLTEELFIDIKFKIIPRKFRPCKLFVYQA